MGDSHVRVDMRQFVGKLQYYCKDKITRSVREPGVKTEIYRKVYEIIKPDIPEDTGALADSPEFDGEKGWYGQSLKHPDFYSGIHYGHGSLSDKGLWFDPIYEEVNGTEVHYAGAVENFRPYESINMGKDEIYEEVKKILTRELSQEV